ncbi:MAG: hypothetical protein M1840_008982 [Geoglossum simile]|nr:MAG: hypothetical protein M1840_008982 [Geoglossum simile]
MAPRVLYRVCYGNADPEPWQARLLTIKPAALHDFCRYRVQYADYPAIIQQANSTVRGTFVAGLTPGDISRLDYFEGGDYARRKVKVRVLAKAENSSEKDAEGEEVETEAYVWIGREGDLEDSEWDFDEFVREKMALWA